MRKRVSTLSFLFLLAVAGSNSQSITLTFTGVDMASNYVRLDRIIVKNLTRGWQETLYWPDTVLTLHNMNDGSWLSQNNPNPFSGETEVSVYIQEENVTTLTVYDLNGKSIIRYSNRLAEGTHRFKIQLNSRQTYLLEANDGSHRTTIKMINTNETTSNQISYTGFVPTQLSSTAFYPDNLFFKGDKMEYIGFSSVNNTEMESGNIIQPLEISQTNRLLFSDTNCVPYVSDYEGNRYEAILVGSQCWMKENLRTSHFTDGYGIPLGPVNDYYENRRPLLYHPSNNPDNVETYGYLYNWGAVTGNHFLGYKALCPTGWHIPDSGEWLQMLNNIKEQSEYICGDDSQNIAKALASTFGWNSSENECAPGHNQSENNVSGFDAQPAGHYGMVDDLGNYAYFWTKSSGYISNIATGFIFDKNASFVRGADVSVDCGCSVRCIRN